MSVLRPLGSYELSAPDTWASIPMTGGELGWAQAAAELLCDGQVTQAALATRLERIHPSLITDPHLLLGVWVPDRSASDVVGLMMVDWVVPDDGVSLGRAYYRGLVDPDPRTGHQVFGRHVDEIEVPAGAALIVREIIARPDSRWYSWRKTLQENVIYTVFPPGCTGALELTFLTYDIDRGDELAADAAAVLDTLRVTLKGAPG